jgi:CheY-like chemotaxis protein
MSPQPEDGSRHQEPAFKISDHFTRKSWQHSGAEIDQFFDRFVPDQYERGFSWRSIIVDQPERVVPFAEQPSRIQSIIARNAEVMLELFEQTSPELLDQMRDAGQQFLEMTSKDQLQNESELHSMCEAMGKLHHEHWLEEFQSALQAGKRDDVDHPGNAAYEDLPPKEIEIMQWQTYANWRVLAGLTAEDYQLLRGISEKREMAEEAESASVKIEEPLILIVEDYEAFAKGIAGYLDMEGYRVIWCSDRHSAEEVLKRESVALAIVDGDLGDKDFSANGDSGQLITTTLQPLDVPYIRLTNDPDRISPELHGLEIFRKNQERLLSVLTDWVVERFPPIEAEEER